MIFTEGLRKCKLNQLKGDLNKTESEIFIHIVKFFTQQTAYANLFGDAKFQRVYRTIETKEDDSRK